MKHRKIVLTVEHMKDGPDGAILGFELVPVTLGKDADGDDLTSCVVRPTAASTFGDCRGPDLNPQTRLALTILRESILEHGEGPEPDDDVPENTKGVSRRLWRARCKERGLCKDGGEEAFKKAFSRARIALVEAGLIAISDGGYVYLMESPS